ncbi:MAG: hypothetical protein Unbinned4512contig1001_30 [Prokaryotic dsDNA virus sp.]|nr:MAG: hypothetical protein Unbinned4512contig1001_30 [Prokaryotic dsDNA virus sp.]|tara:strand:- start:698 stop:886 length:189 start_codon:yes stop_codon:yes gene_type:complete
MNRVTTKDLLAKLEKHEAECAIRLQEINRRLEAGSEKFKHTQNAIYGLYALIIAAGVVDKFI